MLPARWPNRRLLGDVIQSSHTQQLAVFALGKVRNLVSAALLPFVEALGKDEAPPPAAN